MDGAIAEATVRGPDDGYSSPAIPDAAVSGSSTGVPHLRLDRRPIPVVFAAHSNGKAALPSGKPQALRQQQGGFGGCSEADEAAGGGGSRQVTSMRSTLDSWCSSRSSVAADGAAGPGSDIFDDIWPWARFEGDQLQC